MVDSSVDSAARSEAATEIRVVVLMSTNLAVMDMIGRIVADIAKTNWLRATARPGRKAALSGIRFVAVIWAVLFYGGFSVYLIIDQFGQLS